jgi:phosphoheptose isomerase
LYPLQTLGQPGDLAVAISASGNSPNIVNACQWARANGLYVVAITGFRGGHAGGLGHIHIHVPSDNYGLVEDVHLAIGHMSAQALQARIVSEVAVA